MKRKWTKEELLALIVILIDVGCAIALVIQHID